jgi:lipopolysaccharide exporter
LPNQETSLTRKVIHGGLWIISLRVVNRILGFVRRIVLARLLAPQDFGLFGIALLVISTLETFSQTGIQETLIRSEKKIATLLDTAWTVSICRGVLIFLVLWVTAPWVAEFFHSSQAVAIIRVVGLQPLILGFTNIGTVYFQKELSFNKQFAYELSISLTHLTIALILAFVLRNVWALVYGGLAAGLVRTILSYRVHPYRPRWQLAPEQIKEFFNFGKWVLLSSILVFLNSQGDDVFVGKLLGVSALGMY